MSGSLIGMGVLISTLINAISLARRQLWPRCGRTQSHSCTGTARMNIPHVACGGPRAQSLSQLCAASRGACATQRRIGLVRGGLVGCSFGCGNSEMFWPQLCPRQQECKQHPPTGSVLHEHSPPKYSPYYSFVDDGIDCERYNFTYVCFLIHSLLPHRGHGLFRLWW